MKVPYPLFYVTKQTLNRAGVNLDRFPNAGPNCNVTGMRKLFWGWDAALVKHGRYVYKVTPGVYFALRGGMQ